MISAVADSGLRILSCVDTPRDIEILEDLPKVPQIDSFYNFSNLVKALDLEDAVTEAVITNQKIIYNSTDAEALQVILAAALSNP
mmetsp:Transcript_33164/g.50826  ORF Transcript_33164/g.50826 Transcript_33164/m.50826 type:complete len:85 (+) Transcript_33164:547-801(+)